MVNDTDNNDNRVRFMYCDSCDCAEAEWVDFCINKDWLIPDVIFDLIEAGRQRDKDRLTDLGSYQ